MWILRYWISNPTSPKVTGAWIAYHLDEDGQWNLYAAQNMKLTHTGDYRSSVESVIVQGVTAISANAEPAKVLLRLESTEAMKPKSRQQHQIENKSTTYETHYTQALENFFAIQWGKPKLAALDPLKHLAKSQTAIQYNFSSDPASLTSPMRSYLERTAELLNTTGTNLPASDNSKRKTKSIMDRLNACQNRLL
ncbi:hypothetical protein AM587_10003035 [Phytophthora nicotianae]|nr:hypothetical protein AM587_10003035 [Phytophthora nicotianae]